MQLAFAALVVFALVGLAAWFWLDSSAGRAEVRDVSVAPPSAGAGPDAVEHGPRRDATQVPEGGVEVGRSEKLPRPEPTVFDEKRLEGRGRIRGVVQAPQGVEFPLEWTLHVGPARSLIGNERAETRALEFKAGEREFELADLPLGGYALRAQAFGLASSEQQLLLSKPAETDVFLVMQLAVTTFVEGNVRYEDTSAAVGLELALEPLPAGPRAIAVSDVYGHYLFSDVKSGVYTLHFGAPESPVRQSLEVRVGNFPERLPDQIVPVLCDLTVRVLQAPGGLPAAGVELDGWGDKGGKIRGRTDAAGEYRARFLPAGRITVLALFPDGTRAQKRQLLEPGKPVLVELFRGS